MLRPPTDHVQQVAMAINPEELVAEQRSEMRALFGALARLHGFSELPRADDDQDIVSLPELDTALGAVQNAKHLPAPLRLELLMRGVQAGDDSLLPSEQLHSLAASLVDRDTPQDIAAGTASQLLERVRSPKTGRQDPLGRSSFRDLAEPDSLVSSLVPDLQWTSLFTLPRCSATQTTTGSGVQALNITTDTITVKPIAEFRPIVNPLRWPECWLQRSFFKEVEARRPRAAGARALATGKPDDGWRATVLETVDFGMGFVAPNPMQTPLEVVFFFNDPPADGAPRRRQAAPTTSSTGTRA